MRTLTETLTAEQEQAVARRSGPLLLAAGAGSGKTSVLVERFVRAVREDGIGPGRILAITFTERAAYELRERVRERLKELGDRLPMFASSARDTEAAFVGTFHAFCARLLRTHPLMVGLDPDFAILEEGLAGRLREQAFEVALARFVEADRGAALDLLAAYRTDRVRSTLMGTYAELRSRGARRPRLPVVRVGERAPERERAAAEACALLGELLEGFAEAYERLKGERRAVDFDDLELLARDLLSERESVRRAWSERFELLMVDEFQDTNPRQLAILAALERENLFTVGDDRQAIYGFRHADVRLFRDRRDALAERGASLELACNFRSRRAVLDVINAAFEERPGARHAPLLAAREDAQEGAGEGEPLVELLLTDTRGWLEDGQEGPLASGRLPRAAPWRQAEARLLAQRVAELVAGGVARAGDVVVLLRALGDVEVYERALREQGLDTLAAVGGFWGRLEVGDLLSYLRTLANPLDESALYATLASPLVGCSGDGLALLARTSQARGPGRAWETLAAGAGDLHERLTAQDREALVAFAQRLEDERRHQGVRSISQLLERALAASGYREWVLELEWGERRLANVHKLLDLARRFEEREGRDLRGFLDYAAHLKDATGAPEPDAPVWREEPDAVRLMSIHAAKGLEFPVVCVADLGRAQNTATPDLLVDGERMGLRLVRLDGGEAEATLDFEALCEERSRAQCEEEERILYVAMTRARERLLLSGAANFGRWPEPGQRGGAIAWLGPALLPQLPAIAAALEAPVCDLLVRGASGAARVRCRLNAPATVGAVLSREAPRALGDGKLVREAGAPSAGSVQPSEDGPPTTLELGAGDSLSYTALSELERCAYRYYLERVLGLPERRPRPGERSAGDGLEARVRGTLVHGLLESVDFVRGRGPGPGELAALARGLGVRVGAREREQILGLVESVCDSAASGWGPAARVAAAQSVRREHPFAFSLGAGQPLIAGVIDVLAREADGGRLLIDYKSDRVGEHEDLDALVVREYGIQRLVYALAVLRDGAPAVEVVHWFLERPREWVTARFLAAEEDELAQRLWARIRAAQSRGFAVSERPHRALCETCPGRRELCSWDERETMREEPAG